MKIEVLYFSGCPNHAPAVEEIREALREENLSEKSQKSKCRTRKQRIG